MRRLPRFLFVMIMFCVGACEGWPPNDERLRERFLENRAAFEEMREKILATDYVSVWLYKNRDGLHVSARTLVDGPEPGTVYMKQIEIDDPRWVLLMVNAEVATVDRDDQVVSFEAIPPFASRLAQMFRLSADVNVRYTHPGEEPWERPVCKPEHREVPCGRCRVPLVDEWFIHYWWSPDDLAEEASRQHIEREISFAEYQERLDEAYDQCFIEGERAMGYEIEDDR